MERVDIAVVGAGIVGLATAHAVLRSRPGLKVVVLEKEDRPAAHQSGRNSGVIHSGVYYSPGSLKARTVASGRRSLLDFCRANDVAHQIIGKVIVAVDESERPKLHELESRARGSAVAVELIGPDRLAELEPYARGIAALHLPGAGIVDFGQVCERLVTVVQRADGEIRTGSRVLGLTERPGSVVLSMEAGDIEARSVVNCSGLHSDWLASGGNRGANRAIRIVPFRGEYHRLVDERTHLVRSMIYPVPDPRFPFLGAHFTRSIGGEVHAGPNAVLALAREGYSWSVVDFADTWDLLQFPGFRRLVARHWRTGLGEVRRSLSLRASARALQRLVPEITVHDLVPTAAGVRAQAVDRRGSLVEDFVFQESRRSVHVVNAPSPAATASLEIGRIVADRTLERI